MFKNYKQSEKQYNEERSFSLSHKFYCEGCHNYQYLRDKIPYIICHNCGCPIFNTNNPKGKKERFLYIMKKKLKK